MICVDASEKEAGRANERVSGDDERRRDDDHCGAYFVSNRVNFASCSASGQRRLDRTPERYAARQSYQ